MVRLAPVPLPLRPAHLGAETRLDRRPLLPPLLDPRILPPEPGEEPPPGAGFEEVKNTTTPREARGVVVLVFTPLLGIGPT